MHAHTMLIANIKNKAPTNKETTSNPICCFKKRIEKKLFRRVRNIKSFCFAKMSASERTYQLFSDATVCLHCQRCFMPPRIELKVWEKSSWGPPESGQDCWGCNRLEGGTWGQRVKYTSVSTKSLLAM